MSDRTDTVAYGDPLTWPFWEAATRHELVVQHCGTCGTHQFYPRPMCLACRGTDLAWVEVSGEATVYSRTTVHFQIDPALEPPYVAALVDLDEGPRLATNIVGGNAEIGDRVRLTWRDRDDAPPLPVFEPIV